MKTRSIPTPENWQNLQPHPLSELVDFGAGIDLDAMAAHMSDHGYDPDEAIVLHEGKILDGRHRLPAAFKAGVTPTFKVFAGRNATAYVAKKLFRQHLDTSQRAMLAARLTKLDLGPAAPGVQNCTHPTLAEAAETMNVSRRSVANASKVQEAGTAELNEAVRDGTLTVGDAAVVADQPAAVQNQAVDAVRSGLASTASKAAGITSARRPPATKPQHGDAYEGPILCPRCQRVGPIKDCKACEEERRKPSVRGQKPEGPRPGQVLFDWRAWRSDVDRVLRQCDTAAGAFKVRNTPGHNAMLRLVKEFMTKFKAWAKEVSKTEPPEY